MTFLREHQRHIALIAAGVLLITAFFLGREVFEADSKYAQLESKLNQLTESKLSERAAASAPLSLKDATISELAGQLDLTKEELAETVD